MPKFANRLQHAWDAFVDRDTPDYKDPWSIGPSTSIPPSVPRSTFYRKEDLTSSVFSTMSVDVSARSIRHIQLDDKGRYLEDRNSNLNYCLTIEANYDQSRGDFLQKIALTMFEEGHAVIVPAVTDVDPSKNTVFDIKELRLGQVTQWYPRHVKVRMWNPEKGWDIELIFEKRVVAIVYNPFYKVMNQHNSTLQRLIKKLELMDKLDSQVSRGKLDLIIQLPYVVKSDARRQEAEKRRLMMEKQLSSSQYGIAYADGTEKITQLNRPVENTLVEQIDKLSQKLYSELGLTPEIINGTADESAMINYQKRTINPILSAITEELHRKFLTKTARSQGQAIRHFRNPFEFVSLTNMAEIADKMTRNEILTTNEIREGLGLPPSTEKKADELRNTNMPTKDTEPEEALPADPGPDEGEE